MGSCSTKGATDDERIMEHTLPVTGGSITVDQPVDFLQLCETGLPMLCMTQYLGHHSTDALSKTCRRLKIALVVSGDMWWKQFVLRALGAKATPTGTNSPETKPVSPDVDMDVTQVRWKELSDLVHCNLRRRKALQSLGLDPNYKFGIRKGTNLRETNLNENENLCLLMGNNHSDDYCQWVHLPYRVNVPSTLKPSKRWTPSSTRPRTNVYWTKKYPILWSDAELNLLVTAGRYNIGRVRNITTNVVRAIQEETKSYAPLAGSGNMEFLDPKLLVPAIADSPVHLPLTTGYLSQVIAHPRCRPSTFGEFHGRRRFDRGIQNSFEMDLGSDVHTTDPLFLDALAGSSNRAGNLKPMWDVIEERLLREYMKGEVSPRGSVVVKPFKMLIYGKDGKFVEHRDTKHGPGHFGTLVIVLPVEGDDKSQGEDPGGELVLRCETKEGKWKIETHTQPTRNESAKWHVFMHGTTHKVLPVKCGYRVSLMYQLWVEEKEKQTELSLSCEPRLDALKLLGQSIEHWMKSNGMELLVEFVLPLRYAYDRDSYENIDDWRNPLKDVTLRGSDWWLYRGLLKSLKGTDLTLSLEYNEVCQSVEGWPLGVVTERGMQNLPPEEKSKVIWLHPGTNGFQLEDSSPHAEQAPVHPISVACISIHHKEFLSRYGRNIGCRCLMEGWTHYDDVVYCD